MHVADDSCYTDLLIKVCSQQMETTLHVWALKARTHVLAVTALTQATDPACEQAVQRIYA